MIDFTLVLGVDRKHLEQLKWTYPTWRKHKASLFDHPFLVFYDHTQLTQSEVVAVVGSDCTLVPWPPEGVEYEQGRDKWSNGQRYKMLAGFVHVPAEHVRTRYFLKIDTDVVANGNDGWMDWRWFSFYPGIVSHSWNFTKPPTQMLVLDRWVENHPNKLWVLADFPSLNLVPEEGSERLGHKRIISWCGFFDMKLVRPASEWAVETCGVGKLPVPSQDGYLWYLARRLGRDIIRTNMKGLGWHQWSANLNVMNHSKIAMEM